MQNKYQFGPLAERLTTELETKVLAQHVEKTENIYNI